jgi:hypothetical protein
MQLERKAVSAEPGMAPHGAGTSERDLNIPFDHLLKFQATQCTCNEDKNQQICVKSPSLASGSPRIESPFSATHN